MEKGVRWKYLCNRTQYRTILITLTVETKVCQSNYFYKKNTLTFNISGSEPSIHYFIFKPITPIMIIPIDAIFKKLTGSSNHKIPMVAIRLVPKPDQTA